MEIIERGGKERNYVVFSQRYFNVGTGKWATRSLSFTIKLAEGETIKDVYEDVKNYVRTKNERIKQNGSNQENQRIQEER